jgi:hypothetical protein
MHFVRLGRLTLNISFLIAAEEDDEEPGSLLIDSYPGKVRKLRGEDADRLRAVLRQLDVAAAATPAPPAPPAPPGGPPQRRVTLKPVPPEDEGSPLPSPSPSPVNRSRRRHRSS